MNTKVKIEFFKHTGKFYDSFEFKTSFRCFETRAIIDEAKKFGEFINGMTYTIEVMDIHIPNGPWNKYLFIINS